MNEQVPGAPVCFSVWAWAWVWVRVWEGTLEHDSVPGMLCQAVLCCAD